jgi:hypothetical protein
MSLLQRVFRINIYDIKDNLPNNKNKYSKNIIIQKKKSKNGWNKFNMNSILKV